MVAPVKGSQLDLFGAKIPVVVDERMPPGAFALVSGESVSVAIDVGEAGGGSPKNTGRPPRAPEKQVYAEDVIDEKMSQRDLELVAGADPSEHERSEMDKYGDTYLAKGLARWELMCFLWDSPGGSVCAPWFGSSQDRGWRPKWIEKAQAEAMLASCGYVQRSTHLGLLPGTSKEWTARVFQMPQPGARDVSRKRAKYEDGADEDLFALVTEIGLDGPEADEFFNLLRSLRRGAESDDLYRRNPKNRSNT
jgi:hypothetical protein